MAQSIDEPSAVGRPVKFLAVCLVVLTGAGTASLAANAYQLYRRGKGTVAGMAEAKSTLLDQRITELFGECDDLRALLTGSESVEQPVEDPQPPVAGECVRLREWVDKLAADVAQLKQEAIAQSSRSPVDPERHQLAEMVMNRTYEKHRAAYKARFLDPMVTDEVKVDILGILRLFPEDLDPRDDEVVGVALEILGRSPRSLVRAGMCRNLRGVKSEMILKPLVHALASDPDESVREEAAETLAGSVAHATVRAALEYASTNDGSRAVREEAARALGTGQ